MSLLTILQESLLQIPFLTEFLASFLILFAYQAYCFSLKNKIPQEPLNPEEDAVHPVLGTWRPKVADLKSLPIQEDAKQGFTYKATAEQLYSPVSSREYLIGKKKKTDFEYGYKWDSRRICHFHCQTDLPGVTPEMIHWWFANMCHGKGKYHWYKWWHPVDHVKAWYTEDEIHPNKDPNSYIGHSKYIYEYFGKNEGGDMEDLCVTFFDPKELGYTQEDCDRNAIVCARGSSVRLQMYTGWLIHFVEPKADGSGSIMKSRLWLGDLCPKTSLPRPLRWVLGVLVKLPFVKKIVIPPNMEEHGYMHVAREMNNLGKFLPELYRRAHCKQ